LTIEGSGDILKIVRKQDCQKGGYGMSELIQVRKKAQLTLPQSIREAVGIEEGDFLDIQVRNGEIVLKVKKLIDKDQAWFWTARWQQGENAAEDDIKAGRVQKFSDSKEAVSFLKKQNPKRSVKIDKDNL
jgi:AbrB family looped-hinge helix DNA binding protein